MADEKAGEGKKRKVPKGRHMSAIKRDRQNVKRRAANSMVRASLRTAIKRVVDAVKKKDIAAAKSLLPLAVSKLTKAGRKGMVHKGHASRHIGRLSAMVSKLS